MNPTIIVHGGAGTWPEELRPGADAGCRAAAEAGIRRIDDGATAAVLAAVRMLEDDPRFNAGIGASLNAAGEIQHDAGIMEGLELRCGAVGAVRGVRHPINAALAVMERTRHVLLVGEGAEQFVREVGLETADPSLFMTEKAQAQYSEWKATRAQMMGDTVGAVARDAMGRVAVAVSTGGYTGKLPGRLGDAPVPGAGFYADDHLGGVCCTGVGEGFMRLCLAFQAAHFMGAAMPAQAAADKVVAILGERVQGLGGVILINSKGEAGAAWNTPYMPHHIARPD